MAMVDMARGVVGMPTLMMGVHGPPHSAALTIENSVTWRVLKGSLSFFRRTALAISSTKEST
jgi:hypothetical protein